MARSSHLAPLAVLCLALSLGCSDQPTLSIDITLGYEAGAFQRVPEVGRIEVETRDAAGAVVAAVTTEPGGSFDMGEVTLDQFVQVEVRGLDAAAGVQARGRSLGVVVGDLASDILPVFVQRLGEWARPPGELPRTHVGGIGAVIGERYLMLTGGRSIDGTATGDDQSLVFYDLLALGGTMGGTLTTAAASVVIDFTGTAALFVAPDGATWLDFADGSDESMSVPTGLGGFDRVAGGRTVRGPNASFVVGATRADSPSDKVLIVAADRSVTAATLSAPRQNAAATWVNEVGLVIAGGSTTAQGVEVIAPGATAGAPRAFAPDAALGAAAIAPPGTAELVLVCGSVGGQPAPVRSADLLCATQCNTVVLTEIDLGASLARCEAFSLPTGEILVVGQDAGDNTTRAFAMSLTTAGARELVLREPRRGAAVVPAPNGTLALVGGEHLDGSGAFRVEMLFPE